MTTSTTVPEGKFKPFEIAYVKLSLEPVTIIKWLPEDATYKVRRFALNHTLNHYEYLTFHELELEDEESWTNKVGRKVGMAVESIQDQIEELRLSTPPAGTQVQ